MPLLSYFLQFNVRKWEIYKDNIYGVTCWITGWDCYPCKLTFRPATLTLTYGQFNILQWIFQTLNEHVTTPYPFAVVHASIRISITLVILVAMFSTRPWNSLQTEKQRHYAMFRIITSSGAITLLSDISQLAFDAKRQESELNAAIVFFRILEAVLDACLLWHPEFTFRRKRYPRFDSFSTDTPVSPRNVFRLSEESHDGSTSAIFLHEGDSNRASLGESVTPPPPTPTYMRRRERLRSLPCDLEWSRNNYELPERNVQSSLGFRIPEYEEKLLQMTGAFEQVDLLALNCDQ
jgi:hypothetical protein